mgnify:CR=1 FL=1
MVVGHWKSSLLLTSLSMLPSSACVGRSVATGSGDGHEGERGTDHGTSAASSPDDDGDDDDDRSPEPLCTVAIGHSPGRALDRVRWQNSIADLLGVRADIRSLWVFRGGYAYPVVVADEGQAWRYEEATHELLDELSIEPLIDCDPASTGPLADACIGHLATGLGRLAWRRSLTPAEVDALVAADAEAPADERARGVVEALLTAPAFWTIDESGTPDPVDPGTIVLNDHAIAARLAYFLWNGPPDEVLLDLADAGSLSDAQVRRGEVERLLADPRAARAVADYWESVFQTTDLVREYKDFSEWDEALAQDMREELRRFVADVVLEGGSWSTMLSSSRSFQNATLASTIYADELIGAPPTSTSHEPVELDPDRRPGVLTRAAVMARSSSYRSIGFDFRGLMVARGLLCLDLPAPPAEVDFDPFELEHLSRREAFETYVSHPQCIGCHAFFTPITPAFDHYDVVGRWQTELTVFGGQPLPGEPTFPVDPHGTVHFASGQAEPFDDLAGLLHVLETSEVAHACLLQGQLGFALGRVLDEADACTLEQLAHGFGASGGDLRELVHEIVAKDAFIRTRP